MSETNRTPITSICLALPAYNEEGSIAALIEAAKPVLTSLTPSWTIVVVDDGSRDATASIVEAASAADPRVKLVRHPQNRGLGPAIVTGLKAALTEGSGPGHLVVCMDADMTHPPDTIPSMKATAEAGADLVIASRYQPGSEQHGVPPFRLLLSVGARLLFWHYLSLPGVRDYTCGFRAFRASLLEAGFARFGEGLITRAGFACTDELLVHLAMLKPVIREVPFILRYDRKQGPSKMNLGVTIGETIKLLREHRKLLRSQKD